MKFDLILINPPYSYKKKAEYKKSTVFYHKFILKSFEILKKDAYICAIHPPGYRQVDGQLTKFKNFIYERMLYLEIHGMSDGQRLFKASTKYDWYIAKNI